MKRMISLTALCISLVALLSCNKEEPYPIAREITKFEVSEDSVGINDLVEIFYETSEAVNVTVIGMGWNLSGGEYLYPNPVTHTPKYWKAPETPGSYELSVSVRSSNRDFDFEYLAEETVSIVVH